jgi:hypothetical protein
MKPSKKDQGKNMQTLCENYEPKYNPISAIAFLCCLFMFTIGLQFDENSYGMQFSFVGALGTFLIPLC